MGIFKPHSNVSAAEVADYIDRDHAPKTIVKINNKDTTNVPRFLNRCSTSLGSLLSTAEAATLGQGASAGA